MSMRNLTKTAHRIVCRRRRVLGNLAGMPSRWPSFSPVCPAMFKPGVILFPGNDHTVSALGFTGHMVTSAGAAKAALDNVETNERLRSQRTPLVPLKCDFHTTATARNAPLLISPPKPSFAHGLNKNRRQAQTLPTSGLHEEATWSFTTSDVGGLGTQWAPAQNCELWDSLTQSWVQVCSCWASPISGKCLLITQSGQRGEPAVLIPVYPQVRFLSSCGSDEKNDSTSLGTEPSLFSASSPGPNPRCLKICKIIP